MAHPERAWTEEPMEWRASAPARTTQVRVPVRAPARARRANGASSRRSGCDLAEDDGMPCARRGGHVAGESAQRLMGKERERQRFLRVRRHAERVRLA